MSVLHLIVREIRYRKLNFSLGVLSVLLAAACLVAELTLLHRHDRRTEQIIIRKQDETRVKMAALQDDYRKITKQMGFNVLILPREQNLSDLYAENFAARCMPEDYVKKLVDARIATIQHLLPSLQQKTKWPERDRTIIVMGVRGEVATLPSDSKKPILDAVPAGTMVMGYELHRQFKLEAGQKVTLMGREFTLKKLQEERGTKDDITVWINLREAQEMFDKKGQINGILGLECVCAADSLSRIRDEIAKVLPETQVIEFASQALARAEARQRAKTEADDAVEREREGRAKLRQEREDFAAILVPLVMVGAAVWIGILSLGNVRERRPEIGILRAIGLGQRQILGVFLGRAMLMGLVGAVLGFTAGTALAECWPDASGLPLIDFNLNMRLGLIVLVAAPLLAALASWIPSMMAAGQDPANILSKE